MKKALTVLCICLLPVAVILFTCFPDIPKLLTSTPSAVASVSAPEQPEIRQKKPKPMQKRMDAAAETEIRIEVPVLCQYPILPTGCEATAATMVLQYYGEKITAEDFAAGWLACNTDFYTAGDFSYGPDPYAVFAGDPFSEYAYGCFAPPIVEAINRNSIECWAESLTGIPLDELCHTYTAQKKPLLIWATMGMTASYDGNRWYLPDGTLFTWTAREHCLVLVGYDTDNYFFNDPLTGDTVSYPKELVETRFAELGQQAVYIYPAP